MSNSAGRVRVPGHHQGYLQRVPIQPHDHSFTESPKHLGWKGRLESNWSNILPEADLDCVIQSPTKPSLEHFQQRRTYLFSGKPTQCLIVLTEKVFFLISRWSLPWSNTCLLPLVLLPCSLVTRVPPPSLYLHFRYWKVVISSPHPELPLFYKRTQFLQLFSIYQVLQPSVVTLHKSKLRH